jgi:hypothetical protein
LAPPRERRILTIVKAPELPACPANAPWDGRGKRDILMNFLKKGRG